MDDCAEVFVDNDSSSVVVADRNFIASGLGGGCDSKTVLSILEDGLSVLKEGKKEEYWSNSYILYPSWRVLHRLISPEEVNINHIIYIYVPLN